MASRAGDDSRPESRTRRPARRAIRASRAATSARSSAASRSSATPRRCRRTACRSSGTGRRSSTVCSTTSRGARLHPPAVLHLGVRRADGTRHRGAEAQARGGRRGAADLRPRRLPAIQQAAASRPGRAPARRVEADKTHLGKLNYRNHRKIVVVDGRSATRAASTWGRSTSTGGGATRRGATRTCASPVRS